MDNKKKILIISLLSLVLLAAVVYWLLLPAYGKYQSVKAESERLQSELALARATANSYQNEKEQHEQAKLDLDKFSKLFTTEMRDGSNVILLGLKAATSKVEITSIIPGDIVENENYLELPLDITAQANYPNMLAFCTDIERLPNLTDIRILNIASVPPVNTSSNVTVNISIIIFSASTPEEVLGLEEIRQWAIGRSNIFQPAIDTAAVLRESPFSTTPPTPIGAAQLIGKGNVR